MENNNKEEEKGMFLTLAAPSMPVPLAPKSFQVWRETTSTHHHQLPLPNPTALHSSANAQDHGSGQPPKRSAFVNYEVEPGLTVRLRHNMDHEMDPKKLKRVLSNRVSAQKSRIKKLQYVADLERKHKELETQVAVLRPQVRIAREHKQFLEMEHRELKMRTAACQEHYRRTEEEIAVNKAEIARLVRKLAILQQQQQQQQQHEQEQEQEEREEEVEIVEERGFDWGSNQDNVNTLNLNLNEPSLSSSPPSPSTLAHPFLNMPPPTL